MNNTSEMLHRSKGLIGVMAFAVIFAVLWRQDTANYPIRPSHEHPTQQERAH